MNKKQLYTCAKCGADVFQYPARVKARVFCSRACYAASMAGGTPHNKGARTVVEKPCRQCGGRIAGVPSEVGRRRYCGKGCAAEALRGDIAKVLQRYTLEPSSECWLWTGSKRGGYGRLRLSATGSVEAHRASYEYHVGPIAEGLVIDHLCRNRACINPAHLEPVTNRENIRRGMAGRVEMTDDHRRAIADGTRRRFADPSNRAAQRAILDKARADPKRLAALAAVGRTPEARKRQSETMKRIWAERKAAKNADD